MILTQLLSKFISLPDKLNAVELILGNSNPKFSGVTSTMLQTCQHQQKIINLAVMGKHHLDANTPYISFWQAAILCNKPLPNGLFRVFHARRNDEMIQALLLKYIFGAKIKILFTSTAQRQHSKFTCWLMGKMDAVISTCSYAAAYLRFTPAAIVPHGVDSNKFTPAADKSEIKTALNLPQDQLIGIFGRVRKQKGVHLLVRACIELFKTSSGYSCIICGAIDDVDLVKQLKQEIEQAGLERRILFLGEQPFELLPKLFQACSIVTALSDNEGFGLTVLEAMSSGCAVVASKAGAWPDIIQNGQNGYLLEDNTQVKVQQALSKLMFNPDLIEQMALNAQETVLQHYQIEQEAKALVDIYLNLQKNTLASSVFQH
ncbi:glycosyltransferase family 4 protein [Catenovulum sp. 2E275]|uniref:glycosyltransferase family 4 protein n=1 Tax=Catenovulum sp. 2E275 TaxID=2980497 RepID=UPI0021CE6B43|nr:glycosyltransferase family 4 protein [Catenovulum sp. 2E275]MCU4674235.1 glycosyltransferase family 4 protein [Catenovulum sp. 2E275]